MSLVAGSAVALPAVQGTATASAAECATHIPTYLVEAVPGNISRPVNPPANPAPKVIRKYIDWSPYDGNKEAGILDTGVTGQLPGSSQVFGGEDGVIYEITQDGLLKSYKDNSDTGGALLTPFRSYGSGWSGYSRVWVLGGRIFAFSHTTGSVSVFDERKAFNNGWYQKEFAEKIPATDQAAVAIASAQSVWGTGSQVFTLANGQIRQWNFSIEYVGPSAIAPRLSGGEVIAADLPTAVSAWSPALGVVYTNSGSRDYSGIVKSYAGSPLASANPEVGVGLYGTMLPDTASCLAAPDPEEKPNFGNASDVPPVDLPTPIEETPSDRPSVLSGKFLLGDGKPAAGLTVQIEPNDPSLVSQDGTPTKLAPLGTATTAADGTWSFAVPDQLPTGLQQVVDANGGVLNATASTFGSTSSGVEMVGVDQVTAAPTPQPAGGEAPAARTALAVAAEAEPAHSVPLVPAAAPTVDASDPTAEQQRSTYAAQFEGQSTSQEGDGDLMPKWQDDKGPAPAADFDPYLVGGRSVRSEAVAPRASGSCYNVTTKVSSSIAYTTVGEAHAYWDAKASFEYKTKLSSSVDVAVKGGSNWALSGTTTLGSSVGSSAGFANQGPYFGKHWRVPISYDKQKITNYCGAVARSSYLRIIARGFQVASGGYVGIFGKDVRHVDGPARFKAYSAGKRARVQAGGTYSLSSGRSVKYAGAVSVMGVSLSASTQFDADHEQKIVAGTRRGDHWIWGAKGMIGRNEGAFYSN
ncbi:hypothetical protein [Streptomyces sp. NPDC094032]|uniref:hypothetical protein n=1 Tax=Streptomyces sp. NPDC094032 TaxID=3155308 RepID=UPI0033254012